jgi:hypothetical protein
MVAKENFQHALLLCSDGSSWRVMGLGASGGARAGGWGGVGGGGGGVGGGSKQLSSSAVMGISWPPYCGCSSVMECLVLSMQASS